MTILIAYTVALFVTTFTAGIIAGILLFPQMRRKVAEAISCIADNLFKKYPALLLKRPDANPILKPCSNLWESVSVMNPAAIYLDGRIHLIYRAIGADGVSRLGYASSEDGVTFDTVLPYPVYAALNPSGIAGSLRHYSPVLYPSGGSWGGVEDPRIVEIDGRIYITFNLFDNWILRIGVISMSKEDFIKHRFNQWEGPTILSNSGREKNWVLFPEKIYGKFAVLHGIIDGDDNRVRIEYIDDLTKLSEQKIDTVDPQKVPDKNIAWHIHVRSAGAPPLKTPYGWLVLYHAHDADEPNRYKLGAMLLDLEDPTKILHRAPHPILEPDADYENDGKPGIVYVCGTVIKDGVLFVYYGGADKITAVASTLAEDFLQTLMQDETLELEAREITHPFI